MVVNVIEIIYEVLQKMLPNHIIQRQEDNVTPGGAIYIKPCGANGYPADLRPAWIRVVNGEVRMWEGGGSSQGLPELTLNDPNVFDEIVRIANRIWDRHIGEKKIQYRRRELEIDKIQAVLYSEIRRRV